MDFIRLTHPISKRVSSDSRLRAFPIDRVPDTNDERPFTGIYTGLSVEIIDPDAIKLIHSGGSFGLSTKTKNVPVILHEVPRVRNINQTQYEQKLAWNEKFGNQNSNPVMVNLLPKIKKNCVEILEKSNGTSDDLDAIQNEEKVIILGEEQPLRTDENSTSTENETIVPMQVDIEPEAVQEPEPELNLVEDPFPIEETLALLPEEAFFLHYSLRCLRVMDFNQTHELTTYEMLEKFCTNDAKFIQKFVVYHHYRSKNWVVKSGIKFGGEFLLYYEGPNYYHASYVVLVSDNNDKSNHLDVQSNYRVSESTHKEVLLVNVIRPNGLEYTNRVECLQRFNEFKITEVLPKRFLINQLSSRPLQDL